MNALGFLVEPTIRVSKRRLKVSSLFQLSILKFKMHAMTMAMVPLIN